MNDNLLELKDLTVRIKNQTPGRRLVNGVNLAVPNSRICAFVGDSGSGKSLIAASIMGILAENLQSSGEILFGERDLLTCSEKQLNGIRGKEIGIVMQNCAGLLNPLVKNGTQILMTIEAFVRRKPMRTRLHCAH